MRKYTVKFFGFILACFFFLFLFGFFGMVRHTQYKKDMAVLITMLGINTLLWIITLKYLI